MSNPIKDAVKVIEDEILALKNLIPRLNGDFSKSVEVILNCNGRIIVTGIGKSGHIGRKIASTLSSTGTPSFFLHPAEAQHGDLGMISQEDILIIISNSGESDEIIKIMPSIRRMGLKIIGFIGNLNSTLAQRCDFIIDVNVEKEACPMNLAPTSSSTATLVMGDALAIALLKQRQFNKKDFAIRHPGGMLGKKLLLTVRDLMHTDSELPVVSVNTSVKILVMEMTAKNLGIVGVVNDNHELIGVVTDGDLRRAIERYENIFHCKPEDIMTRNPKKVTPGRLAVSALHQMEKYSITSVFVVQNNNSTDPIGLIHIHDILKSGIV
ncbi:MAG TPA: KpsF/GutQ family sugar-phosphate isomerase [Candidatus Marinimicrobia bacterium]|nr:KpsF/GutQ family sugar-phosphate isomerase [Candidatus Neomarinimicrobiota bacterium]